MNYNTVRRARTQVQRAIRSYEVDGVAAMWLARRFVLQEWAQVRERPDAGRRMVQLDEVLALLKAASHDAAIRSQLLRH